jgi:hypothetical protein
MARYRRFDVSTTRSPEALDAVRVRRAGLRAAMDELEHALDSPAPGRVDEWTLGVRDALANIHDVWTRHVVDTESPGAFLDELVEEEPRLANQVRRLREEHGEVLSVLLAAEDQLAAIPIDVEAIRATLTRLLCELARHRQRGADLVYEAYDVDIGGGS